MRRLLTSLALLATACSPGIDSVDTTSATTTTTPPPATTTTTTASPTTTPPATTTTTAPPPETRYVPTVTIAGPEEVVFDWTTDRCEDEHIPDIAARAFHDADGNVQLIIGHYVNYRMLGSNLNEVVTDCSGPVLVSDYDHDPARFNDSEWIGSVYTEDGTTIYAVVHNEYRGDTHSAKLPGQCPSRDRLTCLDTSLTMAVSTDGGDTFRDLRSPPNHMIATLPYAFDDEGVPSGLRQPSNIIAGPDGYYYVYSNISDYPDEEQWVCLMRTDDLAEPSSWRFWDGSDFTGQFVNPYLTEVSDATPKCARLQRPQLAAEVQETIVYSESIERYVMMGITFHPSSDEPQFGVYYSFSNDLINWSTRQLLFEPPVGGSVADPDNDLYYAYASILDPDSKSMSFEKTDGSAYLYLSRFNAGGSSLDRDLVRWPIEITNVEFVPPEWTFETDGDTEGWEALNALTDFEVRDGILAMRSNAADPYLGSGSIAVPASYDRIGIRMKVSGSGSLTSQLFFGTDADPTHTEAASRLFTIEADGEFHDYELDMSIVRAWEGLIVNLRLDPAPDADRIIEIDRIWFPEP